MSVAYWSCYYAPYGALETYRELLGNTLDSYLTQVSNRLGTVTKALSIVATISLLGLGGLLLMVLRWRKLL